MEKERLIKFYSTVKNNLSIILLVPTILGGIWQLLELSSMSTSFIRFFSLSQLVADGILILFVLTIFYLSYRLVGHSFNAEMFKINSKNPMPISYGILMISLGTLATILLFPEFEKSYRKQDISIPEIALIIPSLVMLSACLILGIISILEYFIHTKSDFIKKYFLNRWIKPIIEISTKLIIILFFLAAVKIIFINLNPHFSNFRRRLLFPENLLNKEILDQKIITDHKLKFKPKLIYFNDKYFFYEVLDRKKNKKILIVEFSSLIYK
ncbi:hypothetical protein [Flavobacterium sp. XS1P27]|uniref:hypothetical protein n=1 Tax=Flavobacterium sp. XS1P27 TaxID=3401724 RepID=UPI003AAAADF7